MLRRNWTPPDPQYSQQFLDIAREAERIEAGAEGVSIYACVRQAFDTYISTNPVTEIEYDRIREMFF